MERLQGSGVCSEIVSPRNVRSELSTESNNEYAKLDRQKAHTASTLHTELLATAESREEETGLPQQEYSGYLSTAKWPA